MTPFFFFFEDNMNEWEFNRGEWTEAYVFLKLLGDGRIYGANENLQRDELTYLDIVNIIKDETNQYLIFEHFLEDEIKKVRAIEGTDEDAVVFRIITASEMQEKAEFLYNQIRTIRGNRKFPVPELEAYLKELRFTQPKANLSNRAKELYGAKADIIITTEDSFDRTRTIVGFSIKSHLGSSSTLFNCSSTSGFTYQIDGCDENGMHTLNNLDSFKYIINRIREEYSLHYVGCRNPIFQDNINVVDSQMDKILSSLLLINSGYEGNCESNNLSDLCNEIVNANPLNVRNPSFFYPAKFKDFLFDSFAGMTATTLWDARRRLSGGYIDVSANGEMLYYRAISDDVFSNYLLAHTYIDRPDRGYMFELALAQAQAYLEGRNLSEAEKNAIIYENGRDGRKKSKKGDFGYVYYRDGEYYIDINFQVRFR